MPRTLTSITPRQAPQILDGFDLHDVWAVDLDNATTTFPALRELIRSQQGPPPALAVRALFGLRALLGKIFRLDDHDGGGSENPHLGRLPSELRENSTIPSGTLDGPFTLLYATNDEAVYHIVNSTVDAMLLIALEPNQSGQRLLWATYLKPVGTITRLYMALIDPFRRFVVYPGLESWLKRTVAASPDIG